MSKNIPAAYTLAKTKRGHLLAIFKKLELGFRRQGRNAQLLEFVGFVQKGEVSINMSVASCMRFLEQGEWLNVFEATKKETGATGKLLEGKIRKRLRAWYLRRRAIERLLKFQRDTHYAALNLGGPGATRYGICCVMFDIETDHRYATALAGDSLRSVFDSSGRRVLSNDETLALFAIREDATRLAAVRCKNTIDTSKPA